MAVGWHTGDHRAWAVVDVKSGATGANGDNGGNGDPGKKGDDGKEGGSASAIASSADPANHAVANGGAGGKGGAGGNGVDGVDPDEAADAGGGGMGGRGANADATATTAAGDGPATASAGASGGTGGDGGANGFPMGAASAGPSGVGGKGGAATATASAENSNDDFVSVVVTIRGGSGGRGGEGVAGIPNGIGGDGGSATLGPVVGKSLLRGDVVVQGSAEGGSGRTGYFGGNAAEAKITNAVDGSTAGILNLTQIAMGGDGGDGVLGVPGLAGDGSSSLTREKSASMFHLETTAFGGVGGGSFGDHDGTTGGAGVSRGIATNKAGSVNATATAHGGPGGNVNGFYSGAGGAGGSAHATSDSVIIDVTGPPLFSTAFAVGGPAGDGGLVDGAGGSGGMALAEASGFARIDGFVTVDAIAYGGDGGDAHGDTDLGGEGGDAKAMASGDNGIEDAFEPVQVRAEAFGGGGGLGGADGSPGFGGDAEATARGHGDGQVNISAVATGGPSPLDFLQGKASARAFANGGQVVAFAFAQGSEGTTEAKAESNGGIVTHVKAEAVAPVDFDALQNQSEARATVARDASTQPLARGDQAVAFATGLPKILDVSSEVAGDPNVKAAFDIDGSSHMLGLVVLGAAYPDDGSAASRTYFSEVNFDIDVSRFDARDKLKIGLLDPLSTGAAFDTLHFLIKREGAAVEEKRFTSLDDANTYFDDRVIDLGTIGKATIGDMDLDFLLDLTSNDPRAGFNVNLVFGINPIKIPEPATSKLLLLGLGAILSAKVRRKTAVDG